MLAEKLFATISIKSKIVKKVLKRVRELQNRWAIACQGGYTVKDYNIYPKIGGLLKWLTR